MLSPYKWSEKAQATKSGGVWLTKNWYWRYGSTTDLGMGIYPFAIATYGRYIICELRCDEVVVCSLCDMYDFCVLLCSFCSCVVVDCDESGRLEICCIPSPSDLLLSTRNPKDANLLSELA